MTRYRYLCCFLFLLGCLAPVQGQAWLQGKFRNLRQMNKMLDSKTTNQSLTRVIGHRTQAAKRLHNFWQARSPQEQQLFMDRHFKYLAPVYPLGELDPLEQLDVRMDNAWVYANNRRMLAVRVELEYAMRRVQQLMPQMEKDLKISFKKSVPSIPASAKYIFLGEVHREKKIQQLFLDVILKYRKQHPNKQIIVLTEFQYDKGLSSTPFEEEERLEDYKAFFDQLSWYLVPFAGLEEKIITADERQFISFNGSSVPQQATWEGVRLRNAHWARRIQAWAKKYPQAVFFIYAGNAHLDYQMPFSVARKFPQSETFVFSVYQQWHAPRYLFHTASKGRFIKPGVYLTWKNNRWARHAGFDAAYILP